MYTVELSYSQLLAVQNALRVHHADVVADELAHGVDWSLERLPRPGEDRDEKEDDQVAGPTYPRQDDPDDHEFDLPDEFDIDSEDRGLPAPDDDEEEVDDNNEGLSRPRSGE